MECPYTDGSITNTESREAGSFIAIEIVKYGINEATLSGTRLPGYDSFVDHGNIFYWSVKSVYAGREAGVRFALKKDIAAILNEEPTPVND